MSEQPVSDSVPDDAGPDARAFRERAAEELGELVGSRLLKALCEPARVEILRFLTLEGRCDVRTIAANFPQDASVVSRHLATLHEAGALKREKVGRHVYFEVDGAGVVAQMESLLDRCRALVPLCCSGGGSQ